MNEENFKNIVQESIDTEPLNKFGLKLLGLGADSMVFETPGSDKKVIKVSIEELIVVVLSLLKNFPAGNKHERRKQLIDEHRKIKADISEVFGKEHILRSGYFKVKVPITRDTIIKMLADNNYSDEELELMIKQLDSSHVIEIETIAETQIKAPELINPEKFNTVDFTIPIITDDDFRSAGDTSKAMGLIRDFASRDFLLQFNEDRFNSKQLGIIREIIIKIIKFTKKTGMMLDIFGKNNITIFTNEDGTLDYHLLDVIMPGQQKRWTKNIKDDPRFALLRNYYTYYYSIKRLAEKFGIEDNLIPEDLVYFKEAGLPKTTELSSS